jgi:hypothetical protein
MRAALIAVLLLGCAQTAAPVSTSPGLHEPSSPPATDVPRPTVTPSETATPGRRNSAQAACTGIIDDIPMVIVNSGRATLAAAYEVTGEQLAAYRPEAFGPYDPWAENEVVSMCLFDGDFSTMTPGPPEADRSAVRVLVVIAERETLLWSIARRDEDVLPTTDPAKMTEDSAAPQAWGPLAVARAGGGDTARTEGTLVITDTCVFLERRGTRELLVWPVDRTTWNPGTVSVSFQNPDGEVVTVRSGDRVVLGGGGWSEAEDGLSAEEWVATLDWAAPPAPNCVTEEKFFVSDIEF